jgi:hypothetical protein
VIAFRENERLSDVGRAIDVKHNAAAGDVPAKYFATRGGQ